MKLNSKIVDKLREEAMNASKQAYAPYSQFSVGAAVIDREGNIYSGSNIENASYGLAICAERNAIFNAVTKGVRNISAMVIYTPTQIPTAPCGACRQVLREFSKDAIIVSFCDTNQTIETSIKELLPNSFGPENLGKI